VSPAPPPRVADTKRREAAPRTTPQPRIPGEAPSTGSDPATVSTEGVEFPYPEYLQNIVAQVLRRWQRPSESTPLEAEVSFMVHRDGTITDMQFVKRSGSFAFDLEAQGAVEEAGQYKSFGDLPDGWVPDVLFVRFYFSGKRQ
jgi:periplasmic protein TonB